MILELDGKRLGGVLREVRKLREMTRQQAADALWMTLNYIIQLENGRNCPGTHTINKFAKLYNVPASWIYYLAGDPSTELPAVHNKILKAIKRTEVVS